MAVGGLAPLRGPKDLGNFAWANATQDLVGVFGVNNGNFFVNSDFGAPITSTVQGKADYFADIWGDEAVTDYKVVDSVQLLMSFPIVSFAQSYTFQGSMAYDQSTSTSAFVNTFALPAPSAGVIGTTFTIGVSAIGVFTSSPSYQVLNMEIQAPALGTILQFGWTETSVFPWTSLGFTFVANRQRRPGAPGSS
jgi:hypothetical protein